MIKHGKRVTPLESETSFDFMLLHTKTKRPEGKEAEIQYDVVVSISDLSSGKVYGRILVGAGSPAEAAIIAAKVAFELISYACEKHIPIAGAADPMGAVRRDVCRWVMAPATLSVQVEGHITAEGSITPLRRLDA